MEEDSSVTPSSPSSAFASLSLSSAPVPPPRPPPTPPPSLVRRYNAHIREAKAAHQSQDLAQALQSYKAAYELLSGDQRLKGKIDSLERRLRSASPPVLSPPPPPRPPTPPVTLVPVDERFDRHPITGDYHVRLQGKKELKERPYKLPSSVYSRLYDYQREGIHWSQIALTHFLHPLQPLHSAPSLPRATADTRKGADVTLFPSWFLLLGCVDCIHKAQVESLAMTWSGHSQQAGGGLVRPTLRSPHG